MQIVKLATIILALWAYKVNSKDRLVTYDERMCFMLGKVHDDIFMTRTKEKKSFLFICLKERSRQQKRKLLFFILYHNLLLLVSIECTKSSSAKVYFSLIPSFPMKRLNRKHFLFLHNRKTKHISRQMRHFGSEGKIVQCTIEEEGKVFCLGMGKRGRKVKRFMNLQSIRGLCCQL